MMKVLEIKQFNAARDAWTAQRRVISLISLTAMLARWRVCVCEKTKCKVTRLDASSAMKIKKGGLAATGRFQLSA